MGKGRKKSTHKMKMRRNQEKKKARERAAKAGSKSTNSAN